MHGKTATILAIITLAAVVVFTGSNYAGAQLTGSPPTSTDRALSQVLVGNYRVFGDIFGNMPVDQIRRIEFHEQYVILIDYTGAGRVVPISQFKQIRWEPI